MIAAELAPGVLLGTVAGVFVDRWDRKRVLVLSNVLQAAVVSLLLLMPHGWLWIVYAVAAAQSVLAAFSQPAESALLPNLVGNRELVPANALNALNNRLARLIGVPLGGVLLGAVGLPAVVLVDCATFITGALLVALIAAPTRARTQAGDEAAQEARSAWSTFVSELFDGLALVRRDRAIAVIFVVLGLMTYGGTMLDPLYPAWVQDELRQGPEVFALLMTTHATFGILGTALVGRFGVDVEPRQLICWSSLVSGAAGLVMYNVPVLTLAVSVSAVVGVTSVISSVAVETVVQRGVRDEFRGRVFGALGASGALLSLLGAATGGLLGEVVGVVPMLSVAALLIVTAGFVALLAFRPSRAQQSGAPHTGVPA
jgi:MFS family permease